MLCKWLSGRAIALLMRSGGNWPSGMLIRWMPPWSAPAIQLTIQAHKCYVATGLGSRWPSERSAGAHDLPLYCGMKLRSLQRNRKHAREQTERARYSVPQCSYGRQLREGKLKRDVRHGRQPGVRLGSADVLRQASASPSGWNCSDTLTGGVALPVLHNYWLSVVHWCRVLHWRGTGHSRAHSRAHGDRRCVASVDLIEGGCRAVGTIRRWGCGDTEGERHGGCRVCLSVQPGVCR